MRSSFIFLFSAFLSIVTTQAQTTWTLSGNNLPTTPYSGDDLEVSGSDLYSCGSYFTGTSNELRLYKSSDNGVNMNYVSNSNLIHQSFAITSYNSDLLVSGYDLNSSAYKLVKSINNGQSWSGVSGWPAQFRCSRFEVDATTIYACGANTSTVPFTAVIYSSGNGGSSWSPISTTGLSGMINANALIKHNTKFFLAGIISNQVSSGNYSVMVSTDNCQSWASSGNGLPSSFLANDFISTGTNLYATGFDYDNSGTKNFKLYVSTDDGANWSEIITSGFTAVQGLAMEYSNNRFFLSVQAGDFGTSKFYISDAVSTGIEQLAFSPVMQVYPVPAANQVFVTGNADTYTLVSEAGVVAMKGLLAKGTTTINTAGLATGIYFLRTGNGSVAKIIKE